MSTSISPICMSNSDNRQRRINGFGAYCAAAAASGCVGTIPTIFIPKFLDKITEQGKLEEVQIKSFHDAAKEMLAKNGLSDKVTIHYHAETPRLKGEIPSISELLNPFEQVKKGYNAFFTNKAIKGRDLLTGDKITLAEANTIHMPKKSISYTTLHEVGHCLNYNLSKIGKVLQKIRPVSIYAPAILAFYAAVTRKSKPDENGKYTGAQKLNNFMRNNAGILSLIAGIPILAEEAMATMKGKKFAEKFLSPELVKKYTKGTRTAYLSYLSMIIFGALAAHTAVKVKDRIIAKKEADLGIT